jgi:PAS domain S-box-containing protein
MKSNQYNNLILKVSIIGGALGFTIALLFIGIDLYTKNLTFSFTELINYHLTFPSVWLIDLLPFALVFLGYRIGKILAVKEEITQSQVETELKKTKQISDFVEKLRSGEINAEYTLVNEEDVLGKSLINLRDKLKSNTEEEQARKNEDAQRHWVTEGLAKFGEILRMNSSNLEDLSYHIVSNLVKYIRAEQATFFILNETESGERYFEQTACFAYDRKKFSDKRIEWGEGLIGACAIEKQTIFITNATEKYVAITSGLGKANPRCILIVPLKIADDVHGVIELASFKIYEPFEIEFVEKVAESIGSTISSVKINLRTNLLLTESQDQAVKMAEQEEIMRQNMEELKATQREAAKQAEEFISFTNSVNHTLIRAEYDTHGILLYSNTKFMQKLEYPDSSEVIGHHISMFINDKDKEWFNRIWENLAAGGRHFEGDMKHVTKYGNDLWTMATYVCVRNNEGGVDKILFLGTDITENKKLSLDFEGQIQALNRSSIKAEFAPDGKLIECNDKFLSSMGYSIAEAKQERVFSFIQEEDLPNFKVIWDNVLNRIPFEGRIRTFTKDGKEKWFHATYTSANNMYGEIAKIIFISYDITEQIRMEIKNKKQTEQLKIQEERLQQSQIELSRLLQEAREEMKSQYKKIETVKVLNERTLEGALDAIVTINDKDEVEFFNRAAEDLWGFARKHVIGKHISKLLPLEYNGKGDNFLGNFFKYGQGTLLRTRTEVYIIDKAGNTIPVLVTLSEANVENQYNLTAFIQNIEVELF